VTGLLPGKVCGTHAKEKRRKLRGEDDEGEKVMLT